MWNIYIYGNSNFHFYNGDSFEESLLNELLNSDEDKYLLLKKHIQENKTIQHPQDTLFDLIINNIYLPDEFCRGITQRDVFDATLFRLINPSKLGLEIISLMEYSEIVFLLDHRFYRANIKSINIRAMHSDYYWESITPDLR